MQRRNFIKSSTASAAGFMINAGLISGITHKQHLTNENEQPFHLKYAIHDGCFKNSAGSNFTDQIKFAYANGFRAIEDNGMMDRTSEQQKKIGDTLTSLGMEMGVFVLNFDHWPVKTSLTSGNKEWMELLVTYVFLSKIN